MSFGNENEKGGKYIENQKKKLYRAYQDNKQICSINVSESQLQVMSLMLKHKCWKLFVLLAIRLVESRRRRHRECNSLTIVVDPIEILRVLSSRGLRIRRNEINGRFVLDILRLVRESREFCSYLELLLADNSPLQFAGQDIISLNLLKLLRTTGLPLMRSRELIDDRAREQMNAIAAVNSRLRCASRNRLEIVIREEDFDRERELCNNNLEDNDFHYNNHRVMRRREFLGEDDLIFYVLYKMI